MKRWFAVRAISRALEKTDPEQRRTGLERLSQLSDIGYDQRLLGMLARCLADPDDGIREEAQRIITNLGKPMGGGSVEKVISVLREGAEAEVRKPILADLTRRWMSQFHMTVKAKQDFGIHNTHHGTLNAVQTLVRLQADREELLEPLLDAFFSYKPSLGLSLATGPDPGEMNLVIAISEAGNKEWGALCMAARDKWREFSRESPTQVNDPDAVAESGLVDALGQVSGSPETAKAVGAALQRSLRASRR